MLEDLGVLVNAAIVHEENVLQFVSEGRVKLRMYDESDGKNGYGEPIERLRPTRTLMLDAFNKACDKVKANEESKQRKRGRSDEGKQVEARLNVMEKKQLVELMTLVLDTHPEVDTP
eukprot:4511092-Pyramimonas_sp.AAC.1